MTNHFFRKEDLKYKTCSATPQILEKIKSYRENRHNAKEFLQDSSEQVLFSLLHFNRPRRNFKCWSARFGRENPIWSTLDQVIKKSFFDVVNEILICHVAREVKIFLGLLNKAAINLYHADVFS